MFYLLTLIYCLSGNLWFSCSRILNDFSTEFQS